MKRLLVITLTVMALFTTTVSADVIYKSVDTKEKSKTGNVTYAQGITEEMCKPDYWASRLKSDPNEVLMNASEIDAINRKALDTPATNMFDLENLKSSYDADSLLNSLINQDIPGDPIYLNNEKLTDDEKAAFFDGIKDGIRVGGWHGTLDQKYAVCVKHTEIRSWPYNEFVGYIKDDTDDELVSYSLAVNDPFVIRQKAEVNGKTFYWGYSDAVTGWVEADDLAICADKTEWLDAWKVKTDAKDFVVVTEDGITLEPSIYAAYSSRVHLRFGAILKLVPEADIPLNIAERGTWNNYVIYLPTRDESGNYVKKMALISEHCSVSVGFLPMTQSNILKLSLACLGNRYGWGGMLESMDCSLLTRNVYRCFGFALPRNTNWQREIPGTAYDLKGMSDKEKTDFLATMPAGTMLYMRGHTMLLLGVENGVGYVVSDLGTVKESVGDDPTRSIQTLSVTPLTVRRGTGVTWLASLETAVAFKIPKPVPETTMKPDTKLKGTSFTKVTKKKKSLKLKWKKVSNITGYKLQIARKKSFKKAKTYTVKKTKKTIKGLKKKKTYYLRIRTYKLDKSANKEIYYYSDWSKVTKKKTK